MMGSMAYWYNIGLLVLNAQKNKFLVCEKAPNDVTDLYIMPGGQMEGETAKECLERTIKKEVGCGVDPDSLEYIGEYADTAAGAPDRDVAIDLYRGKLLGEPEPTGDIKRLHWVGKEDVDNPRLSPIVRNQIIPSLVDKGILE